MDTLSLNITSDIGLDTNKLHTEFDICVCCSFTFSPILQTLVTMPSRSLVSVFDLTKRNTFSLIESSIFGIFYQPAQIVNGITI